MAVVAALRVARDLPADAVVVVLLPDHGRGYLSNLYDDAWLSGHGFADLVETPHSAQDATAHVVSQPDAGVSASIPSLPGRPA